MTGASAGLGRAVARRFGVDRANVVLIARGRDGLEAARTEIEEAGGRALVVPADVADAEAIEAAAARAEETFGPIDIWINNAMATVFAPVAKITPEEFKRST
ncbi:MAG TPA: SDR family NAD(P)-dependent oxidoreductase, partial [Vicinamibacterales bacterium]